MPYGDYSSLGKPSPDATAKTIDASSCTSWSESSSSSNNSNGAANLRSNGRINHTNNNILPSFLNRSLDLESVFEDDDDDDDEEQDKISVITETAMTDDINEKDELIARLSMQVAELQLKVVKAGKKKENEKGKQQPQPQRQPHPKPKPSMFLEENKEESTAPDEEEKRKKNAFPQLATVSTQEDLRTKFARRGKSVRRFNSNDSLDNRSVSLSNTSMMSGDESVSSQRRSPKKKPQTVEQAQLNLQKSFSMRGQSSRGLGLSSVGGNPSNSSLDSRGSNNPMRRGGRRPVPSPAFQEDSSEDSSTESSDSDFDSAQPTNLRRAFAMSRQVDESDNVDSQSEHPQPENVRRAVAMKGQSVRRLQVGVSCDSIDSTSSYKSTKRRAQIVQDQSSTDSIKSMRQGGPVRRMNLTEASKEDVSSDIRRAYAMKGQSVRNLNSKGRAPRSTDSLEPANRTEESSETETSSTEDDEDEPRNLREAWQSAMRNDLGPATVDETVDDDESVEELEEQQKAQKLTSFHENGNILLDMVTEEEEDDEEEEDTSSSSSSSTPAKLEHNSNCSPSSEQSVESSNGNCVSTKIEGKASDNTMLISLTEEDSVEDSDSSMDTDSVFVAAHEHAPHVLTPPRCKARTAAELDGSVLSKTKENSMSVASSAFAEDSHPAMADAATRASKLVEEGKGIPIADSSVTKDQTDDDFLWSPYDFATDEAFEQSSASFASVSSSNANDEKIPAEAVLRSKTTATRRASFGILNERTADLDMDRVLTTLEDSFSGVSDDASVESPKKGKSRLSKIAKASFFIGKKSGAQSKVVNEGTTASSSSKNSLFQKLIPKRRMSTNEVDQKAAPTVDLALNANCNEIDPSMLAAIPSPKSAECQSESSLLSIGYSSDSSVFYASFGSLEDAPPTVKAPRSSNNFKSTKGVFDMSKSGGEFEDLWKSKVRDGLEFSRHSSSGRADGEPVGDLNWEALNEEVPSASFQDSCRRPEHALEEIERAIDRARGTQFFFELDPEVVPSAQECRKASNKSVSFEILLEEVDEANQFDPVVEVARIETETFALEAGSEMSPPRPQEISPVVRFRRPKVGRLRKTDTEAQQITLLEL